MERAPSFAPALAYRLLPQNYGHVPDACNQVEGPPGDEGELFEKRDPVDKHPDGDGIGLPVSLRLDDHLKCYFRIITLNEHTPAPHDKAQQNVEPNQHITKPSHT